MFRTEQEKFWAENFGDEYISRNNSDNLLASNLVFFSKGLRSASKIFSCIEFGANIGMNLKALKLLYPGIELFGIEINETASHKLGQIIPKTNVYSESILDFSVERKWDLILIKGVLIHINPDYLEIVYEKLVQATGRYLLLAEYYNPTPISISYRGHSDRLYKRDFAGELLKKYPELSLVDYGFVYHGDSNFPQDDITWFLLENNKKGLKIC